MLPKPYAFLLFISRGLWRMPVSGIDGTFTSVGEPDMAASTWITIALGWGGGYHHGYRE